MLSLIIVHYNSKDSLRRCLRTLLGAATGIDYEVIVVDNGSAGMAEVPAEFSGVRWILNGRNLGFSRAINQGVKATSGKLVVFLNHDTQLLPGSLQKLCCFFEKASDLEFGPVGGKLLFPGGRLQPSCGPFPHLANLAWRLPLPAKNRRYYLGGERARGDGAGPVRVDWVTGAFMAVRRSVFDRLGGFDPDFFLYYEDVDFCLRAREAGFDSYYLPTAVAYHHNPYAARREKSPELKRIIQRSRLTYFEKHRPSWETAVLKTLHRLERV